MEITVQNANGTSRFSPPFPYASWIEYWESYNHKLEDSKIYFCPACGKKIERTDFVGAHVSTLLSKELFIVPLCRQCNNRTDFLSVDQDLLLKVPSNL